MYDQYLIAEITTLPLQEGVVLPQRLVTTARTSGGQRKYDLKLLTRQEQECKDQKNANLAAAKLLTRQEQEYKDQKNAILAAAKESAERKEKASRRCTQKNAIACGSQCS